MEFDPLHGLEELVLAAGGGALLDEPLDLGAETWLVVLPAEAG